MQDAGCIEEMCLGMGLESKEHEERDHQTKQSHRFGKGKSKDGVSKTLLLEGRISAVTEDKGPKNHANSNA